MRPRFKILKTASKYKKEHVLSSEHELFIENSRKQIANIISGEDQRIMLIVGPCSIHNRESALEYGKKLIELQQKVKDKFLLVMRVYFEKPRTRAGWKGILYDPYLTGINDIESGIDLTRKIMLQLISMGVPVASEVVDPHCYQFFNDLISWACIGARTTTSQLHRQHVSGFNVPVGYKNDTNGSIHSAIEAIEISNTPHTYFGIDDEGELKICISSGNSLCHVILRGSKNNPNYGSEAVKQATDLLQNLELNPNIIIDCAHDNCGKDIKVMPEVFKNVISQIFDGNAYIKGIMLESNLEEGAQNISSNVNEIRPTVSITDPCISWEVTENLIMDAYNLLNPVNAAQASINQS